MLETNLCWARIGSILFQKNSCSFDSLTKHEMFGHPPFVDTNLGISNRSRSPDIDGVITMRRSGAGRGPNCEGVKPPFQLVFPWPLFSLTVDDLNINPDTVMQLFGHKLTNSWSSTNL